MDIVLTTINSRIERMSKRRQKIAIRKLPKKILKNCRPISVGEMIDQGENVSFDVTFSYS